MIVYDAEIKKAILQRGEKPVPGIEYCAGWGDHAGMGISVVCAYSYADKRFHVFTDVSGFSGFQSLIDSTDLVVGFNSITFDDPLCSANGIRIKTGYDILREVYRAKGLDPFPQKYTKAYKGVSLNALADANGFGCKNGIGALAPVLWQQGKIREVVDYCRYDVKLTKSLMDKILNLEPLIDPKTGRELIMRIP